MKMHILLPLLLVTGCAASQREGYVLRPDAGELLPGGTTIIKASPRSGTQGGEMIWDAMRSGASTGRHVHLRADEFFYVIAGHGVADLGANETPVKAGDVIFIPRNQEHRIRNTGSSPLELVFFLDKPGLVDEFRSWYELLGDSAEPLTLEKVNEMSRKYGTIYRTLQ